MGNKANCGDLVRDFEKTFSQPQQYTFLWVTLVCAIEMVILTLKHDPYANFLFGVPFFYFPHVVALSIYFPSHFPSNQTAYIYPYNPYHLVYLLSVNCKRDFPPPPIPNFNSLFLFHRTISHTARLEYPFGFWQTPWKLSKNQCCQSSHSVHSLGETEQFYLFILSKKKLKILSGFCFLFS